MRRRSLRKQSLLLQKDDPGESHMGASLQLLALMARAVMAQIGGSQSRAAFWQKECATKVQIAYRAARLVLERQLLQRQQLKVTIPKVHCQKRKLRLRLLSGRVGNPEGLLPNSTKSEKSEIVLFDP